LLAPRPTPKLEDHPFSAVREYSFNIFAATLQNWMASPPSTTWGRGMLWWQGTHLTWHVGLATRFLLLSDSWGLVDMGRSLWQDNGSAIYNCCWSSPAHSFFSPSPTGLVTIFYCLKFETPQTWRARSPYLYPPQIGWLSYTSRHWVPVSSPFQYIYTPWVPFRIRPPSDRIGNVSYNSSSIVARLFIAADTYLPRCCLAVTAFLRFLYWGFQPSYHSI
jgi:hypothetical protein